MPARPNCEAKMRMWRPLNQSMDNHPTTSRSPRPFSAAEMSVSLVSRSKGPRLWHRHQTTLGEGNQRRKRTKSSAVRIGSLERKTKPWELSPAFRHTGGAEPETLSRKRCGRGV
ncbi:Hypothetical predicted protein [Podarcis lilfordi]|uniref:Uncharacterized protein n=1 Tax=Podarcis lilfordi TaxID=74358 RepID=A0AA35PFU7_9SAUR|nr:Hypothetical predicted protein [Podarcis lilfordi]